MAGNRWWMVRSEGGTLTADFERSGCVALGWAQVGDLRAYKDRDQLRVKLADLYPHDKPRQLASVVGMLYRFCHELSVGDFAVSYDPERRLYLVGEITSDYEFDLDLLRYDDESWPHVRRVSWKGKVSRDILATASRNSLGSTLSLFLVPEEAALDLQHHLESASQYSVPEEVNESEDFTQVQEDASARAFELIKDRILQLNDSQLEQLVAAILRAMGYKARVTARGPDRGVDVIASPDGLGLESPRIKAEVKHRKATMGSSELRSFLGGLREGDRGLYVSTGGFTREAHYEAERSAHPTTLVDLDAIALLVITHYEAFDIQARVLLPLTRIYMPT